MIFSMNLMKFVPWVRSWLPVSRSVRSHLFLLRAAGGGGEPSGPLLRVPSDFAFSSRTCSVACSTCSGWGCGDLYFSYVLFYIFVFYCMSSSSLYCGFCRIPVFMGTSDMTRDMGSCWTVFSCLSTDTVASWPSA